LTLYERHRLFQSVFPDELQNHAGNESHERSTQAVQQGQFTAPGGKEEAVLVVAEEILAAKVSLVVEGEILIVE